MMWDLHLIVLSGAGRSCPRPRPPHSQHLLTTGVTTWSTVWSQQRRFLVQMKYMKKGFFQQEDATAASNKSRSTSASSSGSTSSTTSSSTSFSSSSSPYIVRRTPSGNLPVYTEPCSNGGKLGTYKMRIQRVFGDQQSLVGDIFAACLKAPSATVGTSGKRGETTSSESRHGGRNTTDQQEKDRVASLGPRFKCSFVERGGGRVRRPPLSYDVGGSSSPGSRSPTSNFGGTSSTTTADERRSSPSTSPNQRLNVKICKKKGRIEIDQVQRQWDHKVKEFLCSKGF
ncbi:unnamed protein product [Amoebophrya sp. A25]|nr:unnamed protein product [Amoebophrya sp. A25]|eukprot:GSA25T00001440001.1